MKQIAIWATMAIAAVAARANSLGVTLRATEKSYWIIPVGTMIYLW